MTSVTTESGCQSKNKNNRDQEQASYTHLKTTRVLKPQCARHLWAPIDYVPQRTLSSIKTTSVRSNVTYSVTSGQRSDQTSKGITIFHQNLRILIMYQVLQILHYLQGNIEVKTGSKT